MLLISNQTEFCTFSMIILLKYKNILTLFYIKLYLHKNKKKTLKFQTLFLDFFLGKLVFKTEKNGLFLPKYFN